MFTSRDWGGGGGRCRKKIRRQNGAAMLKRNLHVEAAWPESVVSRETALSNQCIVTHMDRSASSGHSGEMQRQPWTSASTGQHCAAINCQNNRKNRAK